MTMARKVVKPGVDCAKAHAKRYYQCGTSQAKVLSPAYSWVTSTSIVIPPPQAKEALFSEEREEGSSSRNDEKIELAMIKLTRARNQRCAEGTRECWQGVQWLMRAVRQKTLKLSRARTTSLAESEIYLRRCRNGSL